MNPGGAEPSEPAILLPRRARLGDIGKAVLPAFVDYRFFCRRAGKLVRETFVWALEPFRCSLLIVLFKLFFVFLDKTSISLAE